MTAKKHGWNSLQNYLEVHYKVLRFYSSNLVVPQDYIYNQHTPYFHSLQAIGLQFRTYKRSLVRIDIRKFIEVSPDHTSGQPWARTFSYSFNANIPRIGNLIRYDSPHDDTDSTPIDHHRFHHKHDFTKTPPEVIRIPDDKWPHVGEFFHEVLSSF